MNVKNLDTIHLEMKVTCHRVKNQIEAESEIRIQINDRYVATEDVVDFEMLKSSMKADGNYFIFTCTCGIPGCAGYFEGIRVEHGDSLILWTDLDKQEHWKFDRESVLLQMNKIWEEEQFYLRRFQKTGVIYSGIQ